MRVSAVSVYCKGVCLWLYVTVCCLCYMMSYLRLDSCHVLTQKLYARNLHIGKLVVKKWDYDITSVGINKRKRTFVKDEG
jgi:hypothetical protein